MSYFNSVIVDEIIDGYGFEVENTPMGEMRTVEPTRLVGAQFDGYIVDPNFWTSAVTLGGTVVLSGQSILSTNNSGTTSLTSKRSARYVGGYANRFRGQIRLSDSGVTNNYRRWGSYNTTDGAFFELSGTTLSVVTRKGGVDTKVTSTNWNQTTITPTLTSVFVSEIYWNNGSVYFSIGGNYVHKVSATSTTWSNTMILPVRLENSNTSPTATNQQLFCRTATIHRLGPLETAPTNFYSTGTTSGVQLKYGAGSIHGVIVGDVASNNAVVSFYDGTSASDPLLSVLTFNVAAQNAWSIDMHNMPFYTGLFMTKTVQISTINIIYE